MAEAGTSRRDGVPDGEPADGPTVSHRYWVGIKTLFVLPVVLFLAIAVVGTLRGFPETTTFASNPVLSVFLWTFVLEIFFGPLLLVYFVSKDKRELATELEDVNTRHWLTVGVFAAFSSGVYLLWYPIARWSKGKRLSTPPPSLWQRLAVGKITARVAAVVGRIRDGVRSARGRAGVPSSLESDDGRPDTERAEPDVETILTRAEQAIDAAETAESDGDYDGAMESYDDGIERYATVRQRLDDAAADERRREIEDAVAAARQSMEGLEERQGRIDAVRDHLRGAEQSFRTAIAAHVRQRYTVAERDYRQARDRYEQALAALEGTGQDVLAEEDGVTVTVEAEDDQLPQQLTDWPGVSEADETALAEVGIGTLTDVKDVGSEAIDEFRRRDEISDGLADRLQAATWWHSDVERTFTGTVAIERQRDRASDGQQLL